MYFDKIMFLAFFLIVPTHKGEPCLRRIEVICTGCFHRAECRRKPDDGGRCRYYLKSGTIRLDKNFEMDVDPIGANDSTKKDESGMVGR